jgi:acyl-CoA thioesterase
MDFDAILDEVRGGVARIPDGWMQGRSCFGGLVAALMYRALAARIPADRAVRSMTLSFVGPVAAGPVSLPVEILREGRAVTQAEARLVRDGAVLAVMLASFGAGRQSQLEVVAEPPPPIAPPETGLPIPEAPGIIPEFTRHFDFRWIEGDLPFTGGATSAIGGWIRFRAPGGHSVAHLLGLVDAWPPAMIGRLSHPAPSSSLTWTVEPIGDLETPADWWQYRAWTDRTANGYGHTEARLWRPDGRLAAISRQTVVLFG